MKARTNREYNMERLMECLLLKQLPEQEARLILEKMIGQAVRLNDDEMVEKLEDWYQLLLMMRED